MCKQLSQVKGHYLEMQDKCKNISRLKMEILSKENKLKEVKSKFKTDFFEPPNSIKVMLRLFGV